LTYKITHEIHPNNETRLTLYRSRGVFLSLEKRAAKVLGCHPEEVRSLGRSETPTVPLLDIRSEFRTNNCERRVNSHKRTAFGLDAKRRIFRVAGALDRFDSVRSNYLFLTATLPGDTDEAKWAIAEYAHEIIDGLKSWLSKRMLNRKEFYVWENQRRGALHFHYCVHVPDSKIQDEIRRGFKMEVVRLYDGIQKSHACSLWGRYADCSSDAKCEVLQARVETVYGSVGAYMAGYLAGKKCKHENDTRHRYYPRRWFGVSRPLSALADSYTEKQEYEFTSLKDASETYHQLKEEILDDALTFTEYKHKFGIGKSFVAYHTTEKQLELWSAKKMPQLTHLSHPVIASYVSLTRRNIQSLREVLQNSKHLRGSLPLKSVLSLQDATLQTSLKNGALSRKHIKILEDVFCAYDFSSSSDYKIRGLFHNLRLFNLLTARYHPQMRFSELGWLNNSSDWNEVLDKAPLDCYRGTTSSTDGTLTGEIESRGHVPSDSKPSFIQASLW